ncbi:hypothetical protein O6H91_07G062300 [Diphasiastrum complanatum]|uniref:Uncharacterized protein n=1 Tax=Diphasiastrum complanatum TaxID=34168 RepID=A0ACC2D693_DIPCM|nr:hypothetical protein O6H91_07G062300 [Diphasiastrum complanatum]
MSSTWSNIPPWLTIKKGHLMLALLIPIKHKKVKNMDVELHIIFKKKLLIAHLTTPIGLYRPTPQPSLRACPHDNFERPVPGAQPKTGWLSTPVPSYAKI